MFNVTGGEIVIIVLVALVVLGPERIPEVARSIGRLINKAKTMSQGLQDTVSDITGDPSMKPIKDLGELATRPRQKLAEFAAEAEAEERARQVEKDREQREAEQAKAVLEAGSSGPESDLGPPPARPVAEQEIEPATESSGDTSDQTREPVADQADSDGESGEKQPSQ